MLKVECPDSNCDTVLSMQVEMEPKTCRFVSKMTFCRFPDFELEAIDAVSCHFNLLVTFQP
jgi:hypothetical protein